MPVEERFFAHVYKSSSGHWTWTSNDNHPKFRISKSPIRVASARRMAWELSGNPSLHKKQIKPICGEPRCINPEHQEVKTTELRKLLHKRRYDRLKQIRDLARESCVRCGYSDKRALDFHHRDPREKKCEVSKARNEEAILAEIAKCDVLCANCHRIEHHPSL